MSEEAAQPAEPGQGAETENENALYEPFLEGVPEEIRGQVIPALKAQNGEFTKKFQERSEKFGPYEEAGLLDMEPEAVGNMVALSGILNAAQAGDDSAKEQAQDWWESVGEALGFYDGEDGEGGGEGENQTFDPDDFDPYDINQQQSLVASAVQEALAPFGQYLQSREEQEAEAYAIQEAEQAIHQSIQAIQQDNPDLTEDDIAEIVKLAQLHAETSDDPIRAGYDQYKSYVGKGESALFASKQNQPRPAQGSGSNATPPVTVTSDNVAEIARQRLEQSMTQ